jgi:hypothetical protein
MSEHMAGPVKQRSRNSVSRLAVSMAVARSSPSY